MRFRLSAAVALVVSLPCAAQADRPGPTGRARAAKLFDEALALGDAGRWDAACPKFRESLDADPSVGAQLNVAKCSERSGLLLTAETEYRALLALNESTRDRDRKLEVEARAREALRSLERRIPRVTVAVSPARPAPRLTVDGRTPDSRTKSGAIRLDPGMHTLRVEASGYEPQELALKVAEGDERALEVKLRRTPIERLGPEPQPPESLAVPGWVVGGAGVALAATGAALLVVAGSRAREIEELCGEGARPPICEGSAADAARASELGDEGRALEIGGGVLVAAGGAALSASIVMLALDATTGSEPPVAVAPWVDQRGGGLWLSVDL